MITYRINTTEKDYEDFIIETNLTKAEIIDVIKPIVERERKGGEVYTNDELIDALCRAYLDATIVAIDTEPYIIKI